MLMAPLQNYILFVGLIMLMCFIATHHRTVMHSATSKVFILSVSVKVLKQINRLQQ